MDRGRGLEPREADALSGTDGPVLTDVWRARLREGTVIPAHPLALTAERRLDERRQRALTRYYHAAGAGGVAVGVHTTQFGIRNPAVGLLEPVLALAAEELDRARDPAIVRVAGVVGPTPQAVREAELAARLGYHTALVSLAALRDADVPALVAHVRAVGEVLPVFAFYLQPAVGGRELPAAFWREVAGLERVVAIKVAPFDRYRTHEVMGAVADVGRRDVALYTGNDDHIVADLVTPVPDPRGGPPYRFVGGLLGQWAVWTGRAVELHNECRAVARSGGPVPERLLHIGAALTEANAAIFDAANRFAGCIPGIHEVLRAQGLLAGTWCLDSAERLSAGQAEAIAHVRARFPELTDDEFVAAGRDGWLR